MVYSLQDIIVPVLKTVPESHIRRELVRGFSDHADHFRTIEQGFRALTGRRQDPEMLRRFFQSWAQTNNSAVTVAGIGNRMTLMLHRGDPVADHGMLLRTLTSLDRIIDEDLAVTHRVLHSDMFYQMATDIVGDDQWLSRRYLHPAARSFKDWKDRNSLRDPDLVIALLTTLTHEIYTHGEVEFILPLFQRWLDEEYGYGGAQIRRTLTWIDVHTGPTEKDHFFHALRALEAFAEAMEIDLADYALGEIIETYVTKKAAVIAALCPHNMAEVGAFQ